MGWFWFSWVNFLFWLWYIHNWFRFNGVIFSFFFCCWLRFCCSRSSSLRSLTNSCSCLPICSWSRCNFWSCRFCNCIWRFNRSCRPSYSRRLSSYPLFYTIDFWNSKFWLLSYLTPTLSLFHFLHLSFDFFQFTF